MKAAKHLSLAAVALFAVCCGSSVKSAGKGEGEKIQIFVLLDRGLYEGISAGKAKERDQLCNWMELDLLNELDDEGFAASLLTTREEYTPKPETYLLSVVLKNYVPANETSRLEAGLGEGFVTIEIHYEMNRGKSEKAVLSANDGVVSSMAWEVAANELNAKIAEVVADRLDDLL